MVQNICEYSSISTEWMYGDLIPGIWGMEEGWHKHSNREDDVISRDGWSDRQTRGEGRQKCKMDDGLKLASNVNSLYLLNVCYWSYCELVIHECVLLFI